MSPAKSAFAGLAVGIVAYFTAGNIGSLFPFGGANSIAPATTEVPSNSAPGATEVPKRGTNFGTDSVRGAKILAPTLAPTGTSVAPTPSVSVTPRISSLLSPTPSPSTSVTPRVSVAPSPTPSPTPTPTLSPSVSASPSPTLAPTPTATPTEEPSPTPTPTGTAKVVINEVAWAGTAANASDEWIELYNAGQESIDLTGWALFEGDTRIILLTGNIAPGTYYLVERTDDDTVSDISADVVGSFGGSGLKNLPAGEDLSLRDAGGVIVDSVPCSGGWFAGSASPDYATMERINPLVPGSDPSNWASNGGLITSGLDAAGNPLRGTPKLGNSVTP